MVKAGLDFIVEEVYLEFVRNCVCYLNYLNLVLVRMIFLYFLNGFKINI